MRWNEKEKAAMFDMIAEHYYKNNFGSFAKADIDLLMFHFFLEKKIKDNTNQGILNYNAVSDYHIGKQLGITQQKVKALKIKKQLIYPINYNWEQSLALLMQNARYDKESQKIILSIPDPNLLIEIQNYVEEHGGYIATQINSKLLQLRVEYFFELAYLVDQNDTSKKAVIKYIKDKIKESNKDENQFDENNIGKSLLNLGVNATSIVANLSSIFSKENALMGALSKILQ